MQAGVCIFLLLALVLGLLTLPKSTLTSHHINAIFAVLRDGLPGLIDHIFAKKILERSTPLAPKVGKATQEAMTVSIAAKMGCNLNNSCLDTSAPSFAWVLKTIADPQEFLMRCITHEIMLICVPIVLHLRVVT
jgi:Carboxypeptidase Taq (M32) metallopeptidase